MLFMKKNIVTITIVAVIVTASTVVANTIVRSPVNSGIAYGQPHLVDIGFSQHMALHHDQAVVMAKIVQGRASGRINLLADGIATNQLLEIGEMKGWLKLWRAPALPVSMEMTWIFKNPSSNWNVGPAFFELCSSAPGGMPGLATSQEFDALRKASGVALDTLFLQFMLRHHQGALTMARYASINAETAVVRSAAAQIEYEQRKEIATMRQLLHQLNKEPLPFPDIEGAL
jgi:uncharacterized protein (DUF305 family)